jgi:hypothetical protein
MAQNSAYRPTLPLFCSGYAMGPTAKLRELPGRLRSAICERLQPFLIRLMVWASPKCSLRGEGWTAALIDCPPQQQQDYQQMIGHIYAEVLNTWVRRNLGADSFEPKPIRIIAGKREEIARWFYRGGRMTASGFFWAPATVVSADLSASRDFRDTLAHELVHAFGHQIRHGRPVRPWVDEGAAALVAHETAGVSLRAGAANFPGHPRTSLRNVLAIEETIPDSAPQSVLTHTAGLFLEYFWQTRADNPAGWQVVQRAFRGLEPETSWPDRTFEQAFGIKLEELQNHVESYWAARFPPRPPIADFRRHAKPN